MFKLNKIKLVLCYSLIFIEYKCDFVMFKLNKIKLIWLVNYRVYEDIFS